MVMYSASSVARTYPNLREVLGPPFRSAPAHRIEALFESTDITAADAEGFFDDIGKTFSSAARSVGHALPQIAQVALPIAQAALPIVGTAFGGPIGTAVGGLAGQALGSLAGKAGAGAAAPAPPPTVAAPGGAASALMGLLGDPRLLSSVAAIALGGAGAKGIPVGGSSIAPSAITSLLGMLANRATAEALAIESFGGGSTAEYAEGEADIEARADALLELMDRTYPETYPDAFGELSYGESYENVETSYGESVENYEAYYDSFFGSSSQSGYPESYVGSEASWQESIYGQGLLLNGSV